MNKPCNDCVYARNRADVDEDCDCISLKIYNGYQQGRADAIDEFINEISETIIWDVLAEIMKRNIGASDGADRIIEYLQKIAEQLKEQK